MAQPSLDGQKIHPGLKQCHCKRMSKDVRRNRFARQSWRVSRSGGDGPPHDVCCAEAREACPMLADKDRMRVILIDSTLAHQRLQRFDEVE